MQIIDGRKIRDQILEEVKREVAALPFAPVFCDVLVGNDPVSVQYVKMKEKTAEAVGMKFYSATFPITISTEDLAKEVMKINEVENICGIIIQLPLPPQIDKQIIFDEINPDLDVDCLSTLRSRKFYEGDTTLGFPTALACMAMLDATNIDLRSKKITVLGQGMLVGKPVTALLKFRGLEPEVVRSQTENKEEIIKNADVIISGMGQGKYITGNMVKSGAVLIDAGTSESEGGIVGDVDLESVKDVASYVSPTPGGVGPVTVAMLLRNVLTVAKQRK